jgi:TMEM175 potassium channel family protein
VSEDEPRSESRATDRLVSFSDAVVAIAITLLALDLPVPTGDTVHSFLLSVRGYQWRYLAFLISFVVIAASWRRYHSVFQYIERIDPRVRTYNVVWLLVIVLIPFATKMLTLSGQGSAGVHALQFGFYALLQVLSSAAVLLTVHHVTVRGFQTPGTPPLTKTHGGLESYGIMLGFGASIPLFLVTTNAWLLWIAGPLLLGQLGRLRGRGRRGGDPETR